MVPEIYVLSLMLTAQPAPIMKYEYYPTYQSCMEAGHSREEKLGIDRVKYDCMRKSTLDWVRGELRKKHERS